jgi:hypothetical protein
MQKSSLPFWNFLHASWDDVIKEKTRGLRNYFESHHRIKHPAEFYFRTLKPLQPENEHKYVQKLDCNTTSVFLGVFLKAASQITERKFKEDWEIICATGDLKFDKTDEMLRLVSVDDVKQKYIDEFTAIAEENKGKKCLFLYVSDKEEKKLPQGTNGNITVKWFSHDNTIDDVLDYLFNGFYLPIQHKVSLTMYNLAILKNYLAKSYLEDMDNLGLSEKITGDVFDEYQDLSCFEGYTSASLCLLYLTEDFSCDIKDKIIPKEDDNHCSSIILITLMGTFNKIQRQTASDNNNSVLFGKEGENDELWNIDMEDISILPQKIHDKLSRFCPSLQPKLFYAAWDRFCFLFWGNILIKTAENERDQFYSISKIKYKILDALDYCLDKYLENYHDEANAFWSGVHCFLISEFKLEGYEEIEKAMDQIEEMAKDNLPWREHFRKELDYNDNDRENIKNILGFFEDEEKGLKVAVNFLFAEKTRE